jgi:nucleolar MIF4G domain-containing protein 1
MKPKKEVIKPKVVQKTALEMLADRSLTSNGSTSDLPRTQREKEEDEYIKHLEAKLGWRKGGKKTSSYGQGMDEDGWDGT